MIRIILLVSTIVFYSLLYADWSWAHSIGSEGMERIWDMAVDEQSDLIVVGEFTDSTSINGTIYDGLGLADNLIIKYSSAGQLEWVKVFGSEQEDTPLAVACDAQNNIYLCGFYVGNLVIDGISLMSQGMWDGYLVKLNSDGNLLWVRSFGGPLNDIAYGLDVNSDGYIGVTGWFADTISFPDDTSIISAGGSDIFVLSYDTNGELLWARSAGTTAVEYGYKVAVDEQRNLYVTGVAGPGTEFEDHTLIGAGMFVAKYDNTGANLWVSGSFGMSVMSIDVDNGSPCLQGLVSGRLQGSGQIGQFSFTSYDNTDDAYWASFDAMTGAWIDFSMIGGLGSDKSRDCHINGSPVITGSFEQDMLFNNVSYAVNGESDAFVVWGDTENGRIVTFGGANHEAPTSIIRLNEDQFAIAGWHFGSCRLGNFLIDSGNTANQNGFIASYNMDPSHLEELSPAVNNLVAYPNPFSTSIEITSKSSEIVVYNLRGQAIKRLVSDLQSNKTHWNGTDNSGKQVQSGIYIIHDTQTNESTKILKYN